MSVPRIHRVARSLAARRSADLRRQQFTKYHRSRRERREELIRRIRVVKHYKAGRNKWSESTAVKITANRFDISISVVRNLYRAYIKGGYSALMPRSRAPKRAYQRIPAEVHRAIAIIRTLTGWGPKRISVCIGKDLGVKVSHTTVWRTFKRYHIRTRTYHPKGKSDGIDYRRYQRSRPNSLWHIDFKVSQKLLLGREVNIMVVVDDSSRYCLGWKVIVGRPCLTHVVDVLAECFERYGRPRTIMTDNAGVFVGTLMIHKDKTRKSGFEEFLCERKIKWVTSAPYYPQTNGKAEAFIRTVLAECLVLILRHRGAESYAGPEDLEMVLAEYIEYYNRYRPHSAIGYDTPIHRYIGSRLISKGFAGMPLLAHIDFGVPKRADSPPGITPEYIECRLDQLDMSKSHQRSLVFSREA